jgi:uncharacterized protein YuzE
MKIKYDRDEDALYFRFDDSNITDSEEVRPGIVLDFNEQNQVVGIEILSLKKQGIKPEQLQEMNFEVSP